MNCNGVKSKLTLPDTVSIPNRDFDELQSEECLLVSVLPGYVSIPNRDFDELQCSILNGQGITLCFNP